MSTQVLSRLKSRLCAVAGCWALLVGCAVNAQTLNIGLSTLPTSLDPHAVESPANHAVLSHIYETLATHGRNYHLRSALAYQWQAIDDLTWEFKLRPGVRFHDGQAMNALDAVYSFKRAADRKRWPRGYWPHLEGMSFFVSGPFTFQIKTERPNPLVPRAATRIFIVPRNGEVTSGTGPFVAGVQGDSRGFVLDRHDRYWGMSSEWTRVVLRVFKQGPRRVAALFRGDVDLIDSLPARDRVPVRRSKRFAVGEAVTSRLVYLQLDQGRLGSYYIRTNEGDGLDNPLLKKEVREALSLALDRHLLTSRTLGYRGVPAGQFVPDGFFGQHLSLAPQSWNLTKARAILTRAGYKEGFKLTFHYSGKHSGIDSNTAEAVAQMWRELGLTVNTIEISEDDFFARASRGAQGGKPEFSVAAFGFSSTNGEPLDALRSIAHSYDLARGLGMANRGRYQNREVDDLIEAASTALDAKRRALLMAKAARLALHDYAVVPLFFEKTFWAYRRGLIFTPEGDGRTTALQISSR